MNTKKTILASSAGICIKRNGKVGCMKKGNWSVEKDHIQQIFSDVGAYNNSTGLGCTVNSSYVTCNAAGFSCLVRDNGVVSCTDKSDYSCCTVASGGSVSCDQQCRVPSSSGGLESIFAKAKMLRSKATNSAETLVVGTGIVMWICFRKSAW